MKPIVRLAWGVRLDDDVMSLLYEGWSGNWYRRYDGDVSRPLLFASRRQARAWCAARHARYATRSDSLRDWRFRPVRARETVDVI